MNRIDKFFSVFRVRRIVFQLIRFVHFLWPKESDLVVFSGYSGTGYSDNSRFLYEKFLEEYDDRLRAIWVSEDKNLVDELNSGPHERAVNLFSLHGMNTILRARFAILCNDFCGFSSMIFSKRTVTIQLWHGIPIKSIYAEDRSIREAHERRRIIRDTKRSFTYWISSSMTDRDSTALCTGLPLDRVIVTGYPRNDYLVEQLKSPSSKLHERLPYLKKRVILYAPTWRYDNATRFFPFEDFDLEELISFLESNDAYLLLRGHLCDDILQLYGGVDYDRFKGNRIISANRDTFEDVQELLPYVNILISDYSGIWVDFLLANRPIVFVPYDLDKYRRERGLLYDYEMITPGPKVDSFQGLLAALSDYLEHPEKDADERRFIKSLFHEYYDGLAYERIFELMGRHAKLLRESGGSSRRWR